MGELKDYSGEYKPDLMFEDFSKDALVKLLYAYRVNFIGLMGMWNTVNRERMSPEEAFALDADVYERQLTKFEMPLVLQALNIQGNDVVTMLKYFQVCTDGAREGLYEFDLDIRNNNHAILTFTKCPSLSYFEKSGNEKDIHCLCGPGGVEEQAFIAICKYFNPNMRCNGLKLPPRDNEDDVCCIWEFKLEPNA